MTGQLILVRHGETSWSRSGQHTGLTDLELTAEGERQAEALAPLVARFDIARTLSSPLRRAVRTAHLVGLAEVGIQSDLREWNYGAYEGRTSAEISADLGRPWSIWTGPVPDGETLAEVARRVGGVVEQLRPLVDGGETVALVSHGHALRVLAACWLRQPPELGRLFALSTASLSVLGYEHGSPVIHSWNQTA
jgi:probable phosphoglycerate mutase